MDANDQAGRGRIAALVAAMDRIVVAMDPVTRDIFVRHRLDGWSYQRIAHERGLTVRQVERHLAQAVATLDLGLRRLGL